MESIFLPVDIPNHVIRPIIYRIITKQHNLLLTTTGLQTLAYIIGNTAIGEEWRTTKLNQTKKIIDSIAREWIGRNYGKKFEDKDRIISIYKDLYETKNSLDLSNKENLELSGMDVEPGNSTSVQDVGNEIVFEEDQVNISMDVEQEQSIIKNYHNFIKFCSFDELPSLNYDHHQKGFTLNGSVFANMEHKHKNIIDPLKKPQTLINRIELIKSKHLKNSNSEVKFNPIKDLLGRNEEVFTICGIIRKNFRNEWVLEDPSGVVKLNLENTEYSHNDYYLISGEVLILKGIYFTIGEVFHVKYISFPYNEPRPVTISKRLNKMDYLGINTEQKYVLNEDFFLKLEDINLKLKKNWIAFLGGDMFLDDQKVLDGIDKVLETFQADTLAIPRFIVFQGSFVSKSLKVDIMSNSGNVYKNYSENFNSLFGIINKYQALLNSKTQFIFVPGENDPWFGSDDVYPKSGIPNFFVKNHNYPSVLKNCHFKSNPVKLIYLNQEIVIVNNKYYNQFINNDLENDLETPTDKKDDILDQMENKKKEKYKVVKTLISQQHLFFHKNIINWNFDYFLQLNPLPTSIVLVDTSASSYNTFFNGVQAVNTGKFVSNSEASIYGWWEYAPCLRKYFWKELKL